MAFGALLASVSYFILSSIPLTALGLSAVILGPTLIAVGRGRASRPPHLSELLFECSQENLSAIMEELGVTSKAVYLPSSMVEGGPLALVSPNTDLDLASVEGKLPRRLLVWRKPNYVGIIVSTPGSIACRRFAPEGEATIANLESTLASILTGDLDLADGVSVAETGEGTLIVELTNPRLTEKHLVVHDVLGSTLASIVASVTSEVLKSPVVIEGEEKHRARLIIRLSLTKISP